MTGRSPKRTVVLLQPRVGDMDDFRDRPTPPMSLLHACSLLGDYRLIFVDQRAEENWRLRLDEALETDPVAVGITTMTGPMVADALDMAQHVKQRSKVPVVWGGTHVTLWPEQSIASPAVDCIVLGPGEVIFRDLVARLAAGEPLRDLPGTWGKDGDRVYRNPMAPLSDFSRLPGIPYDVLDFSRYIYTHRRHRMLDYLSSRGCPNECTYCYNSSFHRGRWSARPAKVVLADLDRLKAAYDVDAVYFLDDNFFIRKSRAEAIIRGMPGLGLKYEIQGVDIQTIAAMSDAELDMLEETGLLKITIGVESMGRRIRGLIKKWGSPDAVRAQLRRLANRRFLVMTSFIIGFPFETWEEMQQTVGFALELQAWGDNFRFPQIYNYTPVRGTPLADALEQTGYCFPERLEDWRHVDWDRNTLFADNPKKLKKIEALVFLSKFIDEKHEDYGARPLVSTLYRLYRPIARARLRHGLYGGLLERSAYRHLREWL